MADDLNENKEPEKKEEKGNGQVATFHEARRWMVFVKI